MIQSLNVRMVFLTLIGSLAFSGCNHKYFRTKPTTYVNLDKTQNILQGTIPTYNNTLLNMRCIDSDENATKSDSIGKCQEYLIADISQISLLKLNSNNHKKQMSKIANDLFYIADRNCKKFQEKFFYNSLIENTANQFVGVNFFGVGIGVDFGKVVDISHSQFEMLNTNLSKNMKERKTLKTAIENNITNGRNYTNEKLLVDMIAYDKGCSLFRVEENK